MSKNNSAPVLLIIFNRPDTTEFVFEAIRKAKPSKLYVSADAPRLGNENDKLNCEKARQIVKNVDWECETHYRLLDNNLGCGYGVSSGISWAFENEDRLIILEDDCVPSLPFFTFCNHCLEKYENNEKVWLINGRSHHENSKYFYDQDYIFTHYGHIWGWATWKRCWNQFDIEMTNWNKFIRQDGFLNSFFSREEGVFFNKLYTKLAADVNLKTTTWDYQLALSIHMNGGIAITPSKNLIHNIGSLGTHTAVELNYHKLKASEDFKIEKEPLFVLASRAYDMHHFRKHIFEIFSTPPLYKRVLRRGLMLLRGKR